MSWVWCSYIYSHLHKTGTLVSITKKIAFCLKRGVLLGLKISDYGWKTGVVFRPKSAKGGCFSNFDTSVICDLAGGARQNKTYFFQFPSIVRGCLRRINGRLGQEEKSKRNHGGHTESGYYFVFFGLGLMLELMALGWSFLSVLSLLILLNISLFT